MNIRNIVFAQLKKTQIPEVLYLSEQFELTTHGSSQAAYNSDVLRLLVTEQNRIHRTLCTIAHVGQTDAVRHDVRLREVATMSAAEQRELQEFVMMQKQKVDTQNIIAGITDGAHVQSCSTLDETCFYLRLHGFARRSSGIERDGRWASVVRVCCGTACVCIPFASGDAFSKQKCSHSARDRFHDLMQDGCLCGMQS